MGELIRPSEIRSNSIKKGAALGLRLSANVPPLFVAVDLNLRGQCAVCARALSIYAVLNVCFEPKVTRKAVAKAVNDWVVRNELSDSLTCLERRVLLEPFNVTTSEYDELESRVESLYALVWVLGVVEMSPSDYVPDDFGRLFPNLKSQSSPSVFCREANMRPSSVVISELDFYACIQWKMRECKLKGLRVQFAVEPYVVEARRHALEWVVFGDDWDEVSLDT